MLSMRDTIIGNIVCGGHNPREPFYLCPQDFEELRASMMDETLDEYVVVGVSVLSKEGAPKLDRYPWRGSGLQVSAVQRAGTR